MILLFKQFVQPQISASKNKALHIYNNPYQYLQLYLTIYYNNNKLNHSALFLWHASFKMTVTHKIIYIIILLWWNISTHSPRYNILDLVIIYPGKHPPPPPPCTTQGSRSNTSFWSQDCIDWQTQETGRNSWRWVLQGVSERKLQVILSKFYFSVLKEVVMWANTSTAFSFQV